jgi:ABC-type phosphate transport system substrate-binding protein
MSALRKGAARTANAALEHISPSRKEPHEGAKVKYKGSILRRGVLAGAIVLAGGSAASLAAPPAGASNTQMTAVGSFTTFFMMHALFPQLNNINPLPETGTETQSIAADSQTCSGGLTYTAATTPAVQPPNGSGQGKTALNAEQTTAPANEQGCIDFSRSSSPPAPSTETLPSTSTENGDPAGSDFDYYAYALDGVAPLVGSDAPSTAQDPSGDTGLHNGLTLAQVQGIYACTITNWDQVTVNGVTGPNEPIVTFWPQSGSGTRAVYTDVLGFDPTVPNKGIDICTTATEPAVGFTANGITAPNEENTEDGIIYANSLVAGCAVASPGPSCPAAEAIYIYSAGKFSQEWNDTADNNSTANNLVKQTVDASSTPDNHVGNFLAGTLSMASMQSTASQGETYVDLTPQAGRFNQDTNRGTLAVDGTTVSEQNEWYHNLPNNSGNPSDSAATVPGVRYVYNVTDTLLPGYNGAKMMIGFDNQVGGTKSVLCNGDDATTIVAQGFLPLTTGASAPNGSDAPSGTCRQFAGLSYPGKGAVIHWTTPTFDGRSS